MKSSKKENSWRNLLSIEGKPYENLNNDLNEFAVKVKPDFFYQEKIKTFFPDANKVNVSSTKAENVPGISDHNKKIIEEKEYLLMRYY